MKNPVTIDDARFIYEARRRGMQAQQVAARLGVSPPTLSRWVRGRQPMSRTAAASIARISGIRLADLLINAPDETKAA